MTLDVDGICCRDLSQGKGDKIAVGVVHLMEVVQSKRRLGRCSDCVLMGAVTLHHASLSERSQVPKWRGWIVG